MCRLFGIIANMPVNVEFSILRAEHSLKKQSQKDDLGRKNQDGWGIGFYEVGSNAPKCRKVGGNPPEGFEASMEKYVPFVQSKITIAHVRLASDRSKGTPTALAHPFNFGQYLFAHNGGFSVAELRKTFKLGFQPPIEETTDSPVYFRLIMQLLHEGNDIITAIRQAVEKIKKTDKAYKGLNFLLSDGKSLYAYRDCPPNMVDKYTLYYLERNAKDAPYLYGQSTKTGGAIECKDLSEKCVLFASEKITRQNELWKPLQCGQIAVADTNLNMKIV